MKYIVYVTETSSGAIELEAKDYSEALEKAEMEYENGRVNWDNSFADYKPEVKRERNRGDER